MTFAELFEFVELHEIDWNSQIYYQRPRLKMMMENLLKLKVLYIIRTMKKFI